MRRKEQPPAGEKIKPKPVVGIIMGSISDEPVMHVAAAILEELGIDYEVGVVSAHRTPEQMLEYARTARERGLKVIIAGAGGAAHLPGMTAAETILPVIGVPVETKALGGQDSLFSIVQMPPGVPVGTMAINGGLNAGLFAAQILATSDPDLAQRLEEYKVGLQEKVAVMQRELFQKGYGSHGTIYTFEEDNL